LGEITVEEKPNDPSFGQEKSKIVHINDSNYVDTNTTSDDSLVIHNNDLTRDSEISEGSEKPFIYKK